MWYQYCVKILRKCEENVFLEEERYFEAQDRDTVIRYVRQMYPEGSVITNIQTFMFTKLDPIRWG